MFAHNQSVENFYTLIEERIGSCFLRIVVRLSYCRSYFRRILQALEYFSLKFVILFLIQDLERNCNIREKLSNSRRYFILLSGYFRLKYKRKHHRTEYNLVVSMLTTECRLRKVPC